MKYTTILLLIMGFVTTNTVAQKTITEGQITMELTDVKASDPAVKEQMAMMGGSKTVVAFNTEYSAMELNMMEGLVKMKTITTLDSGNSKMYMDAMGMQYVIPMTKVEKDKMIAEQTGGKDAKYEISYDKKDTKEIAGYKCHKAVIKNENDPIQTINCYVTEKIKADAKVLSGFEAVDLVGFPLEYSMGGADMSMTFTAKEFSTEVDQSVFKVDETKYKEMSLEEFSKMGGMGF
jgi:hypothetical protein